MPITARVAEINESGHRQLVFEGTPNIEAELDRLGEIPLPPYISRPSPVETDANRYQTVYCATAGSVAAPTAGLHFTPALLESLQSQGVELAFVTLHVGAGTFSPIKVNEVQDHRMHPERYQISEGTAAQVNSARAHGKRIVAVGTTTLRLLESAVEPESGRLRAGPGETSIFIYPPRDFKMVDALLTNFHLPCSTLLILASAFASPGRMEGRDLIMRVYAEAIRERYRFYSYGDAMLIQ